MEEINNYTCEQMGLSDVDYDRKLACSIAPALRMLFDSDGMAIAVFCVNSQVLRLVSDPDLFFPISKTFITDQILSYNDEPLFIEQDADITAEFYSYTAKNGVKPKIVVVRGLGFFALGSNRITANHTRSLFLNAVEAIVDVKALDSSKTLDNAIISSSSNIRGSSSIPDCSNSSHHTGGGRLDGRIVIVTGGAQGFGRGIAAAMAAEGAYIAVSDINLNGAGACASQLNEDYGPNTAIAVAVDVSDEESVERMIQETVLTFGGLDVLVSNAGVLIAGALSEMTKKSFDFVTRVNYSGYFLCTKHAAEPMKIQNRYSPDYLMDVIEINSKSGLEGSNKNFAYSGSKFGGIGLTQSFALELVEYGIKVNAICPGNLLDGPLWSDPERGLFKQYLDSGKVTGARSIDDVRRFYESKVPLKRGCTIADVARAIIYVIEQKYETGQAIPVTGGQIMLR